MNFRTLIAGKRSDHETPEPVTFAGDYADGRDLTEALQATGEQPAAEVLVDPRVRAALDAVVAQVAAGWAKPDPLAAPVSTAGFGDVRFDLATLPLFRETVRTELVRREDARGRRLTDGTWQARYARTWYERVQDFPIPPEPSYGLHRYDGIVEEIVTRARFAAEAEYAAQHADEEPAA